MYCVLAVNWSRVGLRSLIGQSVLASGGLLAACCEWMQIACGLLWAAAKCWLLAVKYCGWLAACGSRVALHWLLVENALCVRSVA